MRVLMVLLILTLTPAVGLAAGPDNPSPPLPPAAWQPLASRAQARVQDEFRASQAKPLKTLKHVSSQLHELAQAPTSRDFAQRADERFAHVENDDVLVTVQAQSGQTVAAERAIQAHGGSIEATYGDWIDALVPRAQVVGLDAEASIRWVDLPSRPQPMATSEALGLMNARGWQAAGQNGSGVKVGIIDVGFAGYPALLGNDLPATVDTSCSPVPPNSGDAHGAATAEIVHDVAPAAQLYFVVVRTPVQLGNSVNCLLSKGVTVVNHSVGWLYDGPGNGAGLIESIVDGAAARGIFWANAAGNNAQAHWAGPWSDPTNSGLLSFSPDSKFNQVILNAGHPIVAVLRWNDPFGGSCNDYDVLLIDSAANVVASSANSQTCTQDPIEAFGFNPPVSGAYAFVVGKDHANGLANFDLLVLSQQQLQFSTAADSLAPPADSASAGMVAVGAVNWSTPTVLEPFSSQGPTTDGRLKPDLTAPDRVSTTSLGPGAFPGTSAASPHVAGAAALVKAAHPAMTPAQIKSFLTSRALDVGPPGPDNQFGVGRLSLGAPPTFRLTMASAGSGNITSNPAGINCGFRGNACAADFVVGSTVSLRAEANTGWLFAGWSGPCTFTATGCNVVMIGDGSVSSSFMLAPTVGPNVTAVWRARKGPNHLFTASNSERDSAVNQFGWLLEGAGFCVPKTVGSGLLPVFRLNKGNEFLYTFSAVERDNAVAIFGYGFQGAAFFANQSPGVGLTEVHRLNNGLEHIYIQDPNEIMLDVRIFGYRDEGVALFAPACS
jgi:subtilisin family serine protease